MIVYFSGTGNSRFVAKKLAELTGDELCDATRFTRESKGADFSRPGSYVFVSPVYVSAPPRAFMDFIRKSRFPNNVRAYFVMTCAGGMGGSPEYCRRLASEKGFAYLGTAQVCMPQNYIAFFKTHEAEEKREKVRQALPVIEGLADFILERRELPDPGMKAWEFLSTEMIIGMYYNRVVPLVGLRGIRCSWTAASSASCRTMWAPRTVSLDKPLTDCISLYTLWTISVFSCSSRLSPRAGIR